TLNTALPIALTAYDQDGDYLAYSYAPPNVPPAHGSLAGTAPNITYTPSTDFEGYDSFTFSVSDGKAPPVQATISLTVTRKQIEYLNQPSYTGYTFKGNLTYAVTLDSPITFNGTTTIEGGTVIKMPYKYNPADPGAKLKFAGPINLQQVTSYRPVIVTSADDDTVG